MLLALAILSTVLAVGYSFYFYVYKSYTISSRQSEVQFNVRLASERIDGVVRFASSMEILQNYTGAASGEAIYEEAGSLMHYKDGTATNLLGNNYGDITFNITFNKTADGLLWYNIKGEISGGETFEIRKELQILSLNYDEGEEIIKNFGDSSTLGKAIIFEP